MDQTRSDGNQSSEQEATPGEVGQGQGPGRRRRLMLRRPQLPTIRQGQASETPTQPVEDGDGSPKRSRFRLGRPRMPRVLSRNESAQGAEPRSSSESEPRVSLQRSRTERFPVVAEPQEAHTRAEPQSSRGRRLFRGTDPAEMHLADLSESGGRAQLLRQSSFSSTRQGKKPKRFMLCFPWIKDRRIRSQITRCAASGLFLILMLVVYLSLSITKNINNGEFTILLILIILFTTIIFCHGLIRLCMFMVRPKPSEEDEQQQPRVPPMFGPGGYAVPRRPIRVLLARDEEAAGLESETTKIQPPAYGLWRESVRVDPNRIYWQRNEQMPTVGEDQEAPVRPVTATRPPSYVSEDGVEYVVEARPRSMAPLADVPLPTHPSEAGRVGRQPSF